MASCEVTRPLLDEIYRPCESAFSDSLHKKCLYSEFLRSVFSRIRTDYAGKHSDYVVIVNKVLNSVKLMMKL